MENAGRLRAIDERLQGLPRLEPRLATDEELGLIHGPDYIARIERMAAAGGGHIDGDTLMSAASAEVARLAVGGGLDLVSRVVEGQFERGFALVRPPGHHATPTTPMGFCLYSNIALAAVYARQNLGVQRIFVFDWDVHHGNGTQDCLLAHPDIQFCSFHQWPLYPGSGYYDERGQGNIYNLPLPAGMNDADYVWAVNELVEPLLKSFQPELILVSAGYDAHQDDPLGGMNVTAAGFAEMARRMAFYAPKLVGFLEGGYNPRRLAESVEATVQVWSRPVEAPEPSPRRPSEACLRRVREAQQHWDRR